VLYPAELRGRADKSKALLHPAGVEPTTYRFGGRSLYPLSYGGAASGREVYRGPARAYHLGPPSPCPAGGVPCGMSTPPE
jgi:hypothetical protein